MWLVGALERDYRRRLASAIAEIEAHERPPVSPEEALTRFFALMESMVPLVEGFPRPADPTRGGEPDELQLYRRWRALESGRHA